MSKTFIAIYDGKQVGTRTSKHRDYTHAIVTVDVPGRHEADWMRPETPTHKNRDSFNYYVSIAEGSYGNMRFVSDEERTRAQLIASAGFEAYLVHLTDQRRAQYARIQASLNLEPHVFGWSMSAHNAQKMAQQVESLGKKLVAIVPAELVVAKLKVAKAG